MSRLIESSNQISKDFTKLSAAEDTEVARDSEFDLHDSIDFSEQSLETSDIVDYSHQKK